MIMTTVTHLHREPPEFTFGDRLRKIRRELSMTQEAFAIFAGIHPKSLGQYESGRQEPPHKDLLKIAARLQRATGYPAGWIVMGSGTPGDNDPLSAPSADPVPRSTAYKSHGLPPRTLRIVGTGQPRPARRVAA